MTSHTPSSVSNTLVIIAALFVVAAGLKTAQDLVVPFLLSAFIATIAATPLFWLRNKGVNGSLALSLVIVGMVVALILLGGLLASSTSAFAAKLPFYQERLLSLQTDLLRVLDEFNIPLDLSSIITSLSPASALTVAGSTLAKVGTILSDSLLITLTVVFILAEANSFPSKLKHVLHNPERDLPLFARFTTNMNRYIAIKTSVSIATGVVVTVILWVLGVDFPLLWGLLAMLLNFIPTIGSIIAAVPPVMLAIVQAGSCRWRRGSQFLPDQYGYGQYGGTTLYGPRFGPVYASGVFVVGIMGLVTRPIGMLLSVPLTMTAKIALEANPQTSWIAYLLGPAEPATTQDAANEKQPPAADP